MKVNKVENMIGLTKDVFNEEGKMETLYCMAFDMDIEGVGASGLVCSFNIGNFGRLLADMKERIESVEDWKELLDVKYVALNGDMFSITSVDIKEDWL